MTRPWFAFASLMILTWSAPAAAQRDDFPEAPHFAAKLMLGVGGDAEFETGALPIVSLVGESDMELTWGAGIHYLHPLVRYFAIGGQVSVQSWQTDAMDDAGADRNVWLDLALMPAGLLPVSDKVELYLAVPLGLSFDFWGEDYPLAEVDTALGFTLSLLLGVRFALTDSVGLLAELGYVMHSHEHEVEAGNVTGEFDVDTGQVAIHLGAFF